MSERVLSFQFTRFLVAAAVVLIAAGAVAIGVPGPA